MTKEKCRNLLKQSYPENKTLKTAEKFNDLYYQLSSLTGISVDDIEIKDILKDPIIFKRK